MEHGLETSIVIKQKKNYIRKGFLNDSILPYVLVAPTLILISVILFYPVLKVFNLSLYDYNFARFKNMGTFLGFKNFINIMTKDDIFYKSLAITTKWVLSEVGMQVFLGLIVALTLNQKFRGRGIVRSVVFVPWAVSGVLTTMLWSLMFNQHVGVINDILLKLGILSKGIAWLSNANTVFPSVILAELWRGIPFFAITILASLQGIPNEIYESCAMDGCGKFKQLVYIVLPYLKQTLIFSTLLRAIWEFNSIDMIFTMTNGGPYRLTSTLSIYLMQTAIVEGDYGYGSALAVIVFIILIVFAALYLKVSKYGRELDD